MQNPMNHKPDTGQEFHNINPSKTLIRAAQGHPAPLVKSIPHGTDYPEQPNGEEQCGKQQSLRERGRYGMLERQDCRNQVQHAGQDQQQ